jgi:hypothetical protein
VITKIADVAGGAHVRAAAQLQAEAGHRHDADAIAVLLAEERHRPGGDRFLGRRTSVCTGVLREICSLTIRSIVESPRADGREVREVEAQPIGRDQRAGLLDVRAEHLPQRRVQQVRRGVIAPGRIATVVLHLRGDDLLRLERPRVDADLVQARPCRRDAPCR